MQFQYLKGDEQLRLADTKRLSIRGELRDDDRAIVAAQVVPFSAAQGDEWELLN